MRKSRFSEEKIIGMLHSRLEVGRNNIMSRSFLTTIVAVLITIISLLSIVVMTSTRAESAECPILKEHQDHIYMFYLVSPELRNKIRRKIREGYVMEFRPDFVNWTSEETTVLVEWEWYSYYTWMSIYSTYKLFTGPDGGPSRWQSTEWETGKISSLLSGEISGYDAVFLVRQYDLDDVVALIRQGWILANMKPEGFITGDSNPQISVTKFDYCDIVGPIETYQMDMEYFYDHATGGEGDECDNC